MSIPVTETNEYKQLTKILEVLEQQREQVLKDKEIIRTAYEEALKSPIEYIENLVGGKLNLPNKINIASVPNFSLGLPRYNSSVKYVETSSGRKIQTNGSIVSSESETESDNNNRSITVPSKRKGISSKSISTKNIEINSTSESETTSNYRDVMKHRKMTSELKSYWTEDEQRKLEQLLIKYPEEEVASHRWAKIANHIEGRTPQQVASRTQKFFKKLEKLGLQLPGSTPRKKKPQQPQQPKHIDSSSDKSDNDEILKQKTKVSTNSKSSSIHIGKSKVVHSGFKCDGCDTEPIVGIRWHCEECINEVDLCDDCKEKYEEIGSHNSSHHMSAIDNPDNYFLDEDYKFSYPSGETNYLDPNYR